MLISDKSTDDKCSEGLEIVINGHIRKTDNNKHGDRASVATMARIMIAVMV